jgi:hypothetical protein
MIKVHEIKPQYKYIQIKTKYKMYKNAKIQKKNVKYTNVEISHGSEYHMT